MFIHPDMDQHTYHYFMLMRLCGFFFLPVFNLLDFNDKPHGELLGLQIGSVLCWLVALPKYHYFPFHSL